MIRIFNRHCVTSEASAKKERPENFNRKNLFLHLLETSTAAGEFTVFLDKKPNEAHFTESIFVEHVTKSNPSMPFTIVTKECGSEASSYTALMNHIRDQNYDEKDIIVIIEDDYKVQSNWTNLLKDGLQFGSYVSLYDHPDKYTIAYKDLQVKIYKGLRHWRTSPSTTNSFAVRVKTLLEDMEVHLNYSKGVTVTNDHSKFLFLWSKQRSLVTCIPGAWSHEELKMQCVIEESVEPTPEYVINSFQKISSNSNSNLKISDFLKGGFEGNVSDCPEKAQDLAFLAKNKKRAIQIGFNAGHSADFILGANPDLTLVSFDIGRHGYITTAKNFIDLKYPGRHKLIIGNSKQTFPTFAKNNTNFDFIFIDGGKKQDEVSGDFHVALQIVSPQGVIILNDTCFNPKWDKNYTLHPTRTWNENLSKKLIQVIETRDYCDGHGMSWCKLAKKESTEVKPNVWQGNSIPIPESVPVPEQKSEDLDQPDMAYFA